MMEIALLSATACATAMVPFAKFSHSETPIGPFQTTVPALATASAKRARVFGPMSRPIQPSGISSESTTFHSASALYAVATTLSIGIRNLMPFFSAFSIISFASSTLSSSHREVPMEWPSALKNV